MENIEEPSLNINITKKNIGKEVVKTIIILGTLSIIAFVFFKTGHMHGKVEMCQDQLGMRYLTNDECVPMEEYNMLMEKQQQMIDKLDPMKNIGYRGEHE